VLVAAAVVACAPAPGGSAAPTDGPAASAPSSTSGAATPAGTTAPPPTATPATPAPGTGTISGVAHAGPTCPVAKYPPDPACADKPVAGVAIVVTDLSGTIVTTATTDADGRFSVAVPPGRYTVLPQPREGLMRTPAPESVAVVAGTSVVLDFAYDTGIR
jgi:hypothetical protein